MNARFDLRSKLLDGLTPGFVLFLLLVVVLMIVVPIEQVTGKPGVMVYALSLLAVAMICLEKSLNASAGEVSRVLFGIAGGALTWLVVELSNYVGSFALNTVTGVLIFILVLLILMTTWRRGLPPGIQFFAGTFILFWGAYLFIAAERTFAEWYPEVARSFPAAGMFFLVMAAATAVFILYKSTQRTQRLWGAVLIAFFMNLALHTFMGGGL